MENSQLTIWSEEEMDIFAPKKKTKREIRDEERELKQKKLLERFVLSEDEIGKYNFPLKKEELINVLKKYNEDCKQKYLNSKRGMMDTINYHVNILNLGIPEMLLTSLSQYSNKSKEELNFCDLIVMYKSLLNVLDDESIKGNNFSKFRDANNLSFFGYKQFLIMDEFLKEIIN